MKELPKAYNPKEYEKNIYQTWEESGFFNPDNLSGDPFAIMMPPPNVTGVLHLGHALENTLMDAMARFQRLQGKKVLLLPGTDHAAVATQAKVESLLVKEGIERPREELGREGLLDRIRQYADESQSTILSQIKRMGTSADWSRLAYTFDDERNTAVNTVFKKMYDDGLIYRGYRVVNWSVKGQSTCSDDELVYVDRPSKLYTFKYAKDFPISIATTRPETKLGDNAVAVHPEGRWKEYIGQTFTVDVGAAAPLELQIIGDEHVDDSFGTGALGVTTAHSPIDFEMYERHKAAGTDIGLIQVVGLDGKITAAGGKEYEGLTVVEAREKFVQYLRDNDLIEAEEEITQSVATSDRFKDVVEPLPLTQWFVAVNKEIPGRGKTLKQLMKEAVVGGLDGDSHKRVDIMPGRFEKVYFNWIDNLRDWNISRQIWWGHRIPVWYKGDEIHCDVVAPEGDGWEQDPDTLDTWFSSGTWPFSTLGWPEASADLKEFFPTAWMQMGYEIIFFWMARMILMSTYMLGEVPFKQVYFHGMLRDEQGRKFSKSLDNGVDPLEVIDQYGTDALRFALVAGISPGNDSRFSTEKVEGAQRLVNKLWNISRFLLLQIDEPRHDMRRPHVEEDSVDEWILQELDKTVALVGGRLSQSEFSGAAEALRSFTWETLADQYLEAAKIRGEHQDLLNYILNTILTMWHPFIPFVTEALWSEAYLNDNPLIVRRWPSYTAQREVDFSYSTVFSIVTTIRSLRAEKNIEPAKFVSAVLVSQEKKEFLENNTDIITGLARLEELDVVEAEGGIDTERYVGTVVDGIGVYIDLAGAIDVAAEQERIKKEIASVAPYVASMKKKLSNAGFVDNAPAAVVAGEQEKLADAEKKLAALEEQQQKLQQIDL